MESQDLVIELRRIAVVMEATETSRPKFPPMTEEDLKASRAMREQHDQEQQVHRGRIERGVVALESIAASLERLATTVTPGGFLAVEVHEG